MKERNREGCNIRGGDTEGTPLLLILPSVDLKSAYLHFLQSGSGHYGNKIIVLPMTVFGEREAAESARLQIQWRKLLSGQIW